MKVKDALEDVLREIEILRTLEHPNVMKLHEIIDYDNADKLYLGKNQIL